jgi:hypothetical protein
MIGIVLTFIGVSLLDFSSDSCDTPLRALLLDTCNSKDQNTGLNIHAFLGGMGGAFGYMLTSVDWNKTFLGDFGKNLTHFSRFLRFCSMYFYIYPLNLYPMTT